MNAKRVNWLFLTMVLTNIAVLLIVVFAGSDFVLGIVPNLFLSQMILFVPAMLFLVADKGDKKELFSFKKIKIATIFMIIVMTYLMMPFVTVLNGISMFFTDNVVNSISADILGLPFIVAFFMMAILAPFCEEFFFRGIVYGAYRRSTTPFYAMLFSALLFGIAHMNFNQAPYAFALGIVLAYLREITGSFWAPVICHAVFNGNSVVMLYLSDKMFGNQMNEAMNAAVQPEQLVIAICLYAVIAVVTTSIAVCASVWIAGNEQGGRKPLDIWKNRKENRGKTVTIPLVIGIVLCVVLMIISF